MSCVGNFLLARLRHRVPIRQLQLHRAMSTDSPSVPPMSAQQKAKAFVAERGYFDTHLFIKDLTANGFTDQQAEKLCHIFKEIVNYVVQDFKTECVTKAGQELAITQVMIHIASLKKDMIILEKSEFSALRNENEKLIMELNNLREQVKDEVVKLKSGFMLDMNLEKSRVKETESEISKTHQKLESRVDTEVANLKTIFESYKADSIKFFAGTLLSCLAVCLGIVRLWKT